MKDERINSKLAIIKTAILTSWTVLALVIFVIKAIALKTIPQIQYALTEYSVFTLSLITLLIHRFIILKNDIIDERIRFLIKKLYYSMFKIIIITAIISYFIQLITLESYLIVGFPINMFINFFFSITFLIYYLYARKQGIYFNYQMIENTKKEYFKFILKRILLMVSTGAIAYLLLYLIDLFNLFEIQVLSVTLALGLSVLIIASEYLLLSIYEWNHYNEQLEYEKSKAVLVSKNYFIFSVFTTIFYFFYTVVNLYYFKVITQFELSNQRLFISNMMTLLMISSYDVMFIQFLMILILTNSLKRSLPREIKTIRLIMIAQIIFLGLSFIQTTFTLVINPGTISLVSEEIFSIYIKYSSYFSIFMIIGNQIVLLLLLLLFKRNHKRYTKLFLVIIFSNTINYLLSVFINRVQQNLLYNIIYLFFYLISSVTGLIIYYLASKTFITIDSFNQEALS